MGPWLFEGLSSPLEINSLIERTVGSVTFTRGMPGFTTDIIHSSFFFTLVTESSSAKEHRLTAAIRALAKQREKEKRIHTGYRDEKGALIILVCMQKGNII